MFADAESHSFYRSRRFWISACVVGLLCVPVAIWVNEFQTLESELAMLRDAGLPTNGAELNDFYVVPEGELDTTDLWLKAIHGLADSNLKMRGRHLPFVSDGAAPISVEEWDELDNARTFLAEFNNNLKLIHDAADAGGVVRFPVDFSEGVGTLPPETEESRTVTRLLQLDAHVAAHDGDGHRVLHDILSMFALSDALQAEPCMISQFIRMFHYMIGCHTIQTLLPQCQWNDEQLATLQRAVGNAQFREGLRIGLYGEQAIILTAIEEMPQLLVTSDKRVALPLFQMAIDAAERPWPEAIREQRKILALLAPDDHTFWSTMRVYIVQMLFPATDSFTVAAANREAEQRCTITAIAAERHRLKYGQLPQSLSDIADKLFPDGAQRPADLITDPFTGQQLHYLISDTQITVYSVSENGTDDGGIISSEQGQPPDVGFALSRH
jgi:hypothetical protein